MLWSGASQGAQKELVKFARVGEGKAGEIPVSAKITTIAIKSHI